MTPNCPNCKAEIRMVRPVPLRTDPDTPRWVGRVPEALGFACVACSTLLPLTVTQVRDEA